MLSKRSPFGWFYISVYIMKNLVLALLVSFFWLWIFSAQTFSYNDCTSLSAQCNYYSSMYTNSSGINRASYYKLYSSSCFDYNDCIAKQKQQYADMTLARNKWTEYYNKWRYEDAEIEFNKALLLIGNTHDINYTSLQDNMVKCYRNIWVVALAKNDLGKALNYYKKIFQIDPKDVDALINVWWVYFKRDQYKTALIYFKSARDLNTNVDLIHFLDWSITNTEFRMKETNAQKKWVTDDSYGYRWLPYFKLHNIIDAWNKVKTTDAHEVVIAVIDDGIYINHPDLAKNIRINSKEIPNDGKDNDGNGYKDDYNGWNFIYDSNNLLSLWTHWTMVAGIIWAVRDNKEGIAWIVKKVKLMPIWVCALGDDWICKADDIIDWINYAIDNWADIINLSLWGNELNFTPAYTDVIERAYSKWVVVVIAAWNGDIVSNGQNGIDTDTQPISPLCNYGDTPKRIIGVASLDQSWFKAWWSNYGKCAPFYSLGENIFSTTVPKQSTWSVPSIYDFWIPSSPWYDYGKGTSFAAPIVVWIIWLWFNKYGKVRPDLVWDALKESMDSWYVIDASRYIDILWKKIKDNRLNSTTMQLSFSEKIREMWYGIKKKFTVLVQSFAPTKRIMDSLASMASDG